MHAPTDGVDRFFASFSLIGNGVHSRRCRLHEMHRSLVSIVRVRVNSAVVVVGCHAPDFRRRASSNNIDGVRPSLRLPAAGALDESLRGKCQGMASKQ